MVDNSENILVEFDYQNISLIDPNKIIDSDGAIQDRLIQQENLVMYANLECSVLPRTKLAVGVPQNEAVRTISVGKINFLNPGFKEFLDTAWSDELTGKDTVKGNGVNQPAINVTKNPDLPDDYYYSQMTKSNGEPGVVDNGLLGIVDINVSIGMDFLPVVEITLEDVKGRALFEAGNNSPYAAFFNLPYPLFYLTLKGYLGKAVRIPLMMQSFNASFEPSSHNFRIRCEFYTYKYTLMADITWAQMMAVPSMYKIKIDKQLTESNNPSNTKTTIEPTYSSGGLQKMKEVYSEYKAKGLIDEEFPEITILELKTRLEKLITNIEEQFKKTNLDVLNKLEDYSETLGEYQNNVYEYSQVSWNKKYCDQELVFIKNDTEETTLYQFRKDLIGKLTDQRGAISELEKLIIQYNETLKTNPVVGKDISVPITTKTFFIPTSINDINIEKTYKKRIGKNTPGPSSDEYIKFKKQLEQEILNTNSLKDFEGLIFFTGPNSFLSIIKDIDEKYKTKKQDVENGLTKQIQEQFENKNNGLGFQPTIRNVMAVFFAQGEGFLRLLDDVHTKAWDLREDPQRQKAVLNTVSVDNKNSEFNTPIYPWPQIIGEVLEDGKEKYVLKYPGDSDIANKINAYVPEIWPEVQFVEEFLRGFTEREAPKSEAGDTGNFLDKPNRFSFNAIEFAIGNDVYQNTEEVKFFYEIYERMLLNSFYTKMNRNSVKQYNINNFVSESEASDILTALGNDNPFLIKKLKEYNINSQNYQTFLKQISNQGEGPSYQNFIRKEYNTPYIKNDTTNSFSLHKASFLQNNVALPNIGLANNDQTINYFGQTNVTDEFDFTDLYPLTDLNWCKNNLANGSAIQSQSDTFKTSDTLEYNTSIKLIKNKNVTPVVNFNYKQEVFNQTLDLQNLKTFYDNRKFKDQFATEGNIVYNNYDGGLTALQSTSMFNTPFFSNAIQEGVFNSRYNDEDTAPYKSAAYLFLNSLPLATLRDKYRIYNQDGSVSVKSYILPSLLKFGAIHELPYAWILKYGSIWHRYKTWIDTGNDILTNVWKDTDYIKNYDPYSVSPTTLYQLNVDNQQYSIILDDTITIGLGPNSKQVVTTGFYPKLINDFNYFFQDDEVINQFDTIGGTFYVSGDTLEVISVNYVELTLGVELSGSGLSLGTKIESQLSGPPGSTGIYKIKPFQTGVIQLPQLPGNFIVKNKKAGSFTSQEIQNSLNKNLRMTVSPPTIINAPFGYDISNPTNAIGITPWSSYVLTPDKQGLYLMPSMGSNVNQVAGECFTSINTKILPVPGNPAVHNGAVRLFWQAPNYGYFDVNKIQKPNPDQYLKEVIEQTEDQENFSFFGANQYTNISELFTTFSKEILDKFEEQFLLFSSRISDFESNLSPKSSDLNTETTYENFQGLMREMFKIVPTEGLTGSALVDKLKDGQKTKIQKTLDLFMGYNVVFKYGNPSNFDRRLFYSTSNLPVIDPYTFGGYIPNSLPTQGGTTTLVTSKTQNPDTWKALETYVGFSDITGLVYSDNGSYITDFFVDFNVNFNEANVKTFTPIIKIYAKEKLKSNTTNKSTFLTSMTNYLNSGEQYLNIILDSTLTTSRAKLPNITITSQSEGVKFKEYSGDLTRYEMWDSFKSINDKWISGADLKSKTLFEDILILDRASRDVGNRIFVDIFKIQNMISSMNYNNKMLGIIEQIFVDNRFQSFIIPSYANFYNVQDVSKNPTPKPEGTLEFANSLFGTFLNVDYRDTTAKYVSIYAYVPSQHLAMNENTDYRFRDDAFDLRRATDNPLLASQTDDTNLSLTNKVVGFTVDFGPQNQQVFKQIDIAQDPGLPTAESEQMLTQMANQYRNRGGSSQSVSLYNVYRNRSYKCSVDMLGCALIQPTMYFNLRNIPLFSGPYMITKVTHRISRNGFDTFFDGQRQPFYSIPAVENLLQSLTTQILTTLKERVEEKEKVINDRNTILALKSDVINKINTTQAVLTANQACQEKLNTSFTQYTTQTPQSTSITFDKARNIIVSKLNSTTNLSIDNKAKFLDFIMSTMYIETGSGQKFVSYGNNYAAVRLDINPYGGASSLFNKNYFCISRGDITNIPYVTFDSFESFIDFFISKYKDKISSINESTEQLRLENISRAYVITWPSNIDVSVWNDLSEDDKNKIKDKVRYVINYTSKK